MKGKKHNHQNQYTQITDKVPQGEKALREIGSGPFTYCTVAAALVIPMKIAFPPFDIYQRSYEGIQAHDASGSPDTQSAYP